MEMGSAFCSMSMDRGPYQSGLWLTRKAWGFLTNALRFSSVHTLESLELQMTQLSSSTQLTCKSLLL